MQKQKVTPDNPYTSKYDLTNCDNEPIHIIQTVQSFASIIAVDIDSYIIRQVSSNISKFFNKNTSELLEHPLSDFFPSYIIDSIKNGIDIGDFSEINPITLPINETFLAPQVAIVHQQNNQLIIEIEKVSENEYSLPFFNKIDKAIHKIQSAPSSQKLFQLVAQEVKNITGYSRVMIYQFDKNYNGKVIAEEKESHLEPFLYLNYPSTDIPKQARQLFLKNQVRMIIDVDDELSLLQPSLHPATHQPLNVGNCAARGSSPIHLQYLRNMGVKASLTIAIIEDEKLWGLLACHNYDSKKVLSFNTRKMIQFVGKLISGHLSLYRANEYRKSLLKKNKIHANLFSQMTQYQDIIKGLTEGEYNILEYISSVGVTIYMDENKKSMGVTPPTEEITMLAEYLNKHSSDIIFSTNCLSEFFPNKEIYNNDFAGLLAIRISESPVEYVMWFRPSKTKEVIWGGNPDKEMTKNESGRLSPRKSFEQWKQLVENQSESWTKNELDAAVTLRNDIKEFILKRFYEIKKLHAELQASYEELESFSYSVSHDLRSPLRAIEGFSQILLEDYSKNLDDYGIEVLNTIVESINKMNEFVNDILELSKLAKIEMIYNQIDINTILPSIISDVKLAKEDYEKVEIIIDEHIPLVAADYTMLKQLFYNLIGNAIKYSAVKKNPKVIIRGKEEKNYIVFFVQDNGIGMDMQYADKVFDVFSRLVSDEEFEGTGIGLSIVKRIVDRHQGSIKIESELGQGTTFSVFFPKVEEEDFLK